MCGAHKTKTSVFLTFHVSDYIQKLHQQILYFLQRNKVNSKPLFSYQKAFANFIICLPIPPAPIIPIDFPSIPIPQYLFQDFSFLDKSKNSLFL